MAIKSTKQRLQELYQLKQIVKKEDEFVRYKYQSIQREIAKHTIYKRLQEYRERDEKVEMEYHYTHEDGITHDMDGTINKYTLTLLMELLRTVENTLEFATLQFKDGTQATISFI